METVAREYSAASHLPMAISTERTSLLHSTQNGNEIPDRRASPYLGGITAARFWAVFSIICVTFGIACYDTTIMASTHPVITSYFHSSNAASWLSTVFMLTSTVTQPMMGRLSDELGRKPPYLFALSIFFAATLWCALAQSMLSFIWARAICGIGAGVVVSMANIIVSDLVHIESRGPFQGIINIIYGLWSVVGAASGGAIAETLGWRWVFGIQLPALGTCLAIAVLVVPNGIGKVKSDPEKSILESMRGFDYVGSLLLILSLSSMILCLNLGGNIFPWSHPVILTSLILFALLVPAFLYNETRHPSPILPLELCFRSPHRDILVPSLLISALFNAIIFNVPIFFRAVLLESPVKTGLRLIIIFSSSSISGTLTGFLISWTGRLKWSLMTGTWLILLGTFAVSFGLAPGMASVVYALVLLPTSLGSGFYHPGSLMAILAVSTQEQQAIVTSILMLWRNLGIVTGVAYSSLLLQNSLVYYLERLVTGPQKEEVIKQVRESLDAIVHLTKPYQEQVVKAYAGPLRLTFASTIVLAATVIAMLAPLQLPRFNKKP